MRLLLIPALLAIFFLCSRASTDSVHSPAVTGQKGAPEQPDISRSGREFLEVCSSVDTKGGVDSEGNREAGHMDRNGNRDADRVYRDATCLGWAEGFAEGFLVYGELLNVPRRDRMACVPRGVTNIQVVRVIKKYLADNPGKAHRATRYIASIALAGAFPCKAGK